MPRTSNPPVLTRKVRMERGEAARKHLGRSALGIFQRKRNFDPIAILLEARRDRVARLLPVKYQRMSVSPFTFFRGAVSIMAADLGSAKHTGLFVQLCGDAHVQNLGSFESPDGRITFDINDFDETIPGPFEWDVKRMAASVILAGLDSEHSTAASEEAAARFVQSYIQTIRELAEQPVLVAARRQIHRLRKAQATSAAFEQAERAQPADLIRKYTRSTKSGIKFRDARPVLWPIKGSIKRDVLASLPLYCESLSPDRLHLFHFFRPLDVAFKIVGTGSVGLRDYVVLMEGNGKADPLFLQIKQEVASAYAPYLKAKPFAQEGRRVVEGQHRIQPISDLLLGWTRIDEHDYLVRQLNDHKGSVNLQTLRGEGLAELGEIAGQILARGHARSGDALAIAAYLGNSDQATDSITRYGCAYAKATHQDHGLFQKAIADGRIAIAG